MSQICSRCGENMKYYDRVKRIVKYGGNRKEWIFVKRYHCNTCRMTVRILPSNLTRFKHYDSVIIEGFVKGWLMTDDLYYEDYPCELTVWRWKNSREFVVI